MQPAPKQRPGAARGEAPRPAARGQDREDRASGDDLPEGERLGDGLLVGVPDQNLLVGFVAPEWAASRVPVVTITGDSTLKSSACWIMQHVFQKGDKASRLFSYLEGPHLKDLAEMCMECGMAKEEDDVWAAEAEHDSKLIAVGLSGRLSVAIGLALSGLISQTVAERRKTIRNLDREHSDAVMSLIKAIGGLPPA